MEFVVVVGVGLTLIVGYFCVGLLLKFLLEWWILVFGIPSMLVVGFAMGWVGAIVAVIGFFWLLNANNEWHSSGYYLRIVKRLDDAFYLSDT